MGGVTETQWLWLQSQLLLDEGIMACATCEALSQGPYCGQCGTRLVPEPRICEQCHMPGMGAFCQHCGTELISAVAEAIDAGTYDWDAWARSLEPFLGGLTPQEQALLQRG
jgi:predicted amidophosphoribosyltransferase